MLVPTFNLLEKSVEVSVAVTRPLAALDHIELVQGEGDGCRQTFNLSKRNSCIQKYLSYPDYLSLKLSLRHWGVFVKKWRNKVRVDSHQEECDEDDKTPEVDKEVVAAPVDNLDHSSQDWGLDCL